jgi:NADP-dependent 3-hydroxy acid dehydrogenase YdfG
MVALEVVRASNSALATALPNRLVGVFVGATSGIGEYTLKSFARYVAAPRAYFIGRNQAAGERIATECRELNPRGEFHFVQADTSLLANVDRVCNDIKKHETELNVLVLTQGTLSVGAGMCSIRHDAGRRSQTHME